MCFPVSELRNDICGVLQGSTSADAVGWRRTPVRACGVRGPGHHRVEGGIAHELSHSTATARAGRTPIRRI